MSIVCYDIETIEREPSLKLIEAIEAEAKAPSNWKDPEKIAARKAEASERLLEKYKFTPDGARAVAISFGVIDCGEVSEIEGYQGAEKDLAEFAANYLNLRVPEKLVGFNSLKFDNPILCVLLTRHGQRLEYPIKPYCMIDLCDQPFGKRESVRRPLKGAWNSYAELFGLESLGVDGSSVGRMYEDDCRLGTQEVLRYCKDDVRLVGELYIKLTALYAL